MRDIRRRLGQPSAAAAGDILGHNLPLKGNDRFVRCETADTNTAHSTLTVRDRIDGQCHPVPRRRAGGRRWLP